MGSELLQLRRLKDQDLEMFLPQTLPPPGAALVGALRYGWWGAFVINAALGVVLKQLEQEV